jgi:hypothetical protein
VLALALLMWSSLSAPTSDLLVLPEPPALGEAPKLPRLADWLPPAERVDGATCLPAPLDDAMAQWASYARALPGLCQIALDASARVWLERERAAVAIERASADSRAIDAATQARENAPQWEWWEVLAIGAGAASVGAVLGYLVGVAVGF